MLTAYIRMCGGFRHVVNKYYYGKSGRGVLPDIFGKYSLNTCPSWPQTLSFECREVRRKIKNRKYSRCLFCVRICFYRELGNNLKIKCNLVHEGHIVNKFSILTHARIESDLTKDEKNQLATFVNMDSTALNANNGLIRLFSNRTYD